MTRRGRRGDEGDFDAVGEDRGGEEKGGSLEVLRGLGGVRGGGFGDGGSTGDGGVEGARLGQEARRRDEGAVGVAFVLVERGGVALSAGGDAGARRDGEDVRAGSLGRRRGGGGGRGFRGGLAGVLVGGGSGRGIGPRRGNRGHFLVQKVPPDIAHGTGGGGGGVSVVSPAGAATGPSGGLDALPSTVHDGGHGIERKAQVVRQFG